VFCLPLQQDFKSRHASPPPQNSSQIYAYDSSGDDKVQFGVLHYNTSEPSAGSRCSCVISEVQLLLTSTLLLLLLTLQLLTELCDARPILRHRTPAALSPATHIQLPFTNHLCNRSAIQYSELLDDVLLLCSMSSIHLYFY